jgi:hypothetical protein
MYLSRFQLWSSEPQVAPLRSEPVTFYVLCSLRPENPEQHLLSSIAEVLRLRAIKPLLAMNLRSASLRMTALSLCWGG